MPVGGADNNWFTPGFQAPLSVRRAAVGRYQQPIYMNQRETAPGWREVGQFFTLVEHPLYPRNPEVTRAIHSFDPAVIPMGCYWVFGGPADDAGRSRTALFYRHALGEYTWDPTKEPHRFEVYTPPGWKGKVPNTLLRVLDYGGREPNDKDADLPGPFEPWDWPLFYKLRYEMTKDGGDLREGQKRKEEKRQRKLKFMRDDFTNEMYHLEKFITKIAENLSDVEIKEYFAALGRTKPEVKPFIHLGS